MMLTITLKVTLGFIALMLVIRLMGKKELSEVTPFDIVFLLMLGGILEETLYDNKVQVWHFLYAIILWTVLSLITNLVVRKYDKLRPFIKGEPSILINKGVLDIKELKKNKMETEQLLSLLRQQGIFSIREVKYVILEPGGQISVMKRDSSDQITTDTLPRLIIDEGQIVNRTLNQIRKNEQWVINLLKKEGYEDIEKVYYAEWSEGKGLYVQCNE
ncbi:DUF421 domain-containing protein [Rummeliibacillus stabekisii]|uniref:DUF421 domain-containing protein n=1 Tax=Rummeliibacillus stabekisii TaxID=241244 RepID=A0A143HBB7_9BACL|nr:DUF421 domain-containing protein [Rummeliibacillus stabekisii]AMW98796.1 hypothetical protein ATY39_04635 [Rummeliibacillus stabekisii]